MTAASATPDARCARSVRLFADATHELRPPGIGDRPGQAPVADHPRDVEVVNVELLVRDAAEPHRAALAELSDDLTRAARNLLVHAQANGRIS